MTPFEAESQRFFSYSTSCLYGVHFCYYGPEIYNSFVSHLRKYFNNRGISTTKDSGWNTVGGEVSKIRRQEIEKSKCCILVFCEMFAFCTRCLDELLIIQSCEKRGQLVRAIYFQIDPSIVQGCVGRYGEAIEGHKEKFPRHRIDEWLVALNDTKELRSRTYTDGCQFEFMKKIVEDIRGMLIRTPSNTADCLARQKSHITESQTPLDSVPRGVGTGGRSGIRETNARRNHPNDAGLQPYFTGYYCRKVPENGERFIMGQPSTSAGSTSKWMDIPLGPEMMGGLPTDAGSLAMRTSEEAKYLMQILLALVSKGFCELLSVGSIFKALMEEKVLPFFADEKFSQDLVKALENMLLSFTHWSRCYQDANAKLEATNADLSKFDELQKQVKALRNESKQAGNDEREGDDLLERLQKRKRALEEQIKALTDEIANLRLARQTLDAKNRARLDEFKKVETAKDKLEIQLPRIKGEHERALLIQKNIEDQWSELVRGFKETLERVWYHYFLFSFSLKTENGRENMFGSIFLKTFYENIFKKA